MGEKDKIDIDRIYSNIVIYRYAEKRHIKRIIYKSIYRYGGESMEELNVNAQSLVDYANILKAIAHPARLCIVKGLVKDGPSNVSNMHVCLELAQSTVSQHLSKLKAAGIIKGDRNGTEIIYSIDNDFVADIVKTMKE